MQVQNAPAVRSCFIWFIYIQNYAWIFRAFFLLSHWTSLALLLFSINFFYFKTGNPCTSLDMITMITKTYLDHFITGKYYHILVQCLLSQNLMLCVFVDFLFYRLPICRLLAPFWMLSFLIFFQSNLLRHILLD